MRSGDIVLVPNVPEWGLFSLARLVDDTYHYEPLELSMEQQVNGEVRDYGHWRAVELLTPKGASKYSRFVSAPLQRSLQCRSRIWRVDDHALSINTVLENAQNPEVLLAVGFDARWEAVSEKVREEAHKAALETLERELTHHFYNAGWEAVTREALRVWFPDGEIRLTGGVSEVHHGSDLVIEIANPFSKNEQSEAWLVPVQVKHHVGLEGVAAVRQLEKALLSDALGSRSRIVALVLLTTATALTEEAQVAVQEIKAHHKVQFHVVCRDELLELIVDAIMARKN